MKRIYVLMFGYETDKGFEYRPQGTFTTKEKLYKYFDSYMSTANLSRPKNHKIVETFLNPECFLIY